MILGIIYHGALSVALGFPWFVQDPSANESLYVFQSWVHGFRMPLFFIISGFFTAMLWKKRGAKALVWHRFRRILLPCLLGAVTLVPLCNYAISRASTQGNQRRLNAALTEPAEKSIWAAIRNHRPDLVQMHLEKGFLCGDLHPEYRMTALNWAAINQDLQSVELLIQHGCDPNIANPDGNTPLHAAMFFGHESVAEFLLDRGADLDKKNLNGETPIQSLRVDANFVPYIAGLLQLEADVATVKHGRELIENQLKSLGRDDTNPTSQTTPEAAQDSARRDGLRALGSFLTFYPLFSYLWFLWFLWWYAVCFAILAATLGLLRSRLQVRNSFWAKLHSPLAILAWMTLTIFPLSRMGAIGSLFGPDTSVGLIPAGHVFLYYAIFFGFGAVYYLSDDTQARLGSSWRWLLPLSILVVFPIALDINLGTFGLRQKWIPSDWIPTLSVVSQSLFAWWMSLACIGLFRSCLSHQSPSIRYLSDSSYWLYVAHLPLVVAMQSSLVESSLNGFAKLLIISTVCVGLLLLSYQLLVRYTWIGRLLNGPRSATVNGGATP